MKTTEYTFVASECHCDRYRGSGLNEPHPTSLNSCLLLNFLCTNVLFLLDLICSLYQHHRRMRIPYTLLTLECFSWSPVSQEVFRKAGVKQYVCYLLLVEMWEQRGLSGGCLKPQASHSKLLLYWITSLQLGPLTLHLLTCTHQRNCAFSSIYLPFFRSSSFSN